MRNSSTVAGSTTTAGLIPVLSRTLRLRCAVCGRGNMFRSWFHMCERCENCHVQFEREPGYYLGSIYFNYGVTAILVVILYFSLYFSNLVAAKSLLWSLGFFCLVFPLWFFRYARSLWFGLDHYWDPMEHQA